MYIKVARSRDVHMPERGHAHDAGMDFYVPKFDKAFIDHFTGLKQNEGIEITEEKMVIKPGFGAMIPSGVHTEIPIGYMGIFHNKSGVATKKRLLIGAQVIDCGYDGEVHINVHNVSNRDVEIKPGDKLSQMIVLPIASPYPIEADLKDFYANLKETENRGAGGFGSTGDAKNY